MKELVLRLIPAGSLTTSFKSKLIDIQRPRRAPTAPAACFYPPLP